MKIQLEITPRMGRVLLGGFVASILFGGALAHAQTLAATTTDTLVGSALSTLGNTVSVMRSEIAVLQMSERVARAATTPTGAVTTQTGSWLTRVDHPAPGNYVFVFTPTVFSAPPTCVASANGNLPVAPTVECHGATTSLLICQATIAGGPSGPGVDTGLSLICAGS